MKSYGQDLIQQSVNQGSQLKGPQVTEERQKMIQNTRKNNFNIGGGSKRPGDFVSSNQAFSPKNDYL